MTARDARGRFVRALPPSYYDDLRAASKPWPAGEPFTYVQTVPLPTGLNAADYCGPFEEENEYLEGMAQKIASDLYYGEPRRPWWRRLGGWLRGGRDDP